MPAEFVAKLVMGVVMEEQPVHTREFQHVEKDGSRAGSVPELNSSSFLHLYGASDGEILLLVFSGQLWEDMYDAHVAKWPSSIAIGLR